MGRWGEFLNSRFPIRMVGFLKNDDAGGAGRDRLIGRLGDREIGSHGYCGAEDHVGVGGLGENGNIIINYELRITNLFFIRNL